MPIIRLRYHRETNNYHRHAITDDPEKVVFDFTGVLVGVYDKVSEAYSNLEWTGKTYEILRDDTNNLESVPADCCTVIGVEFSST
jgi:hypothetical protein